MIDFRCPKCRLLMQNPDDDSGKVLHCIRCGQAITLPDLKTPLPALPPEEEDDDEEEQERSVRIHVGAKPEDWLYIIAGVVVIAVIVGAFTAFTILLEKIFK